MIRKDRLTKTRHHKPLPTCGLVGEVHPLRYVAHYMEKGIVYRKEGMSRAMDAWREAMRRLPLPLLAIDT